MAAESNPLRTSPHLGCCWLGLCRLSLYLIAALAAPKVVHAQSIQPVIVEYTEKADGKFEVTNDTLTPMAIVLEVKSFSIKADGRGVFRPLDPGIHVKLSTTSLRLEPKQTYYVFYKATADALPAWFTVYATFTPIEGKEGLKVRIMLPHTVYLYQKKPLGRESIHIDNALFSAPKSTVLCDLENSSTALVRVQQVRAVAGKTSVVVAGFPLLPGSMRHLSIEWKESAPPQYLLLQFPHFEVKEPLNFADPR